MCFNRPYHNRYCDTFHATTGKLLMKEGKMRPTFNVTEFQEVVNVQMNDSMRDLLIRLLDDFDELEVELKAFRNALGDPRGRKTAPRRRFRSDGQYNDRYDRSGYSRGGDYDTRQDDRRSDDRQFEG